LTAEKQFKISSIKSIDNAREIDFCLGTSFSQGIITATYCCQADEIIIVDFRKSNEIYFDSVLIENDICIINNINKTHDPEGIFSYTNDNDDCSITVYNNHIEDFVEKKIDVKNVTCLNQTCYLESDFSAFETILIGTSILCRNSSIFGMVITG